MNQNDFSKSCEISSLQEEVWMAGPYLPYGLNYPISVADNENTFA